MDNLKIYNAVREVPQEAQKKIMGGRLKGFTDINPMWRIKALTEHFGMCGVGWYYEIKEKWIETAMAKDEITANVLIDLYVKVDNEWSKPIQGLGGSMLVASEKAGLYVDDECYKKALTDAISVACKSLGIGADVYWQSDRTKYEPKGNENPKKEDPYMEGADNQINDSQTKRIKELIKVTNTKEDDICKHYKISSIEVMSERQYADCVKLLGRKQSKAEPKEEQMENLNL